MTGPKVWSTGCVNPVLWPCQLAKKKVWDLKIGPLAFWSTTVPMVETTQSGAAAGFDRMI